MAEDGEREREKPELLLDKKRREWTSTYVVSSCTDQFQNDSDRRCRLEK